jgi:Flp pilus assembly pilin Flp
LIAALVAVAAIVGMTALGSSLNTIFNSVSSTLNNAATPAG